MITNKKSCFACWGRLTLIPPFISYGPSRI
jgi:hypothetical protein